MDGSSRARTTGLSCAFLGVTDVLAGRDQCAARTGGIVHEVLLCARLAPVGPGPGQRFLARACGAIPREHAEPGHEEVRASEMERDGASGRARERERSVERSEREA